MKRLAIIGLALILVGVAGFAIPRIANDWDREVLDVGPVLEEEPEPSAWYIDVPAGILVGAGIYLALYSMTRGPKRM